MKKYRSPSLSWVMVFTSAFLTLASATNRPKVAAAARPNPARSRPAGAEPDCGPDCPRRASPAPGVPERRDLFLRAAKRCDPVPAREIA